MGKSVVSSRSTSTPDGVLRNRQVDFEALKEYGEWDGKILPYLPRTNLDIDPSLQLHSDFNLDIDPVTYQVLRSRFWNMNLDHSDTIKRVSGSPLIVYMDDFNTSLLTETGDTIVCGPSVQYFTGHGDLSVQWTLENRSANPGIEDWDVFLQNDPYVGTEHQMDTLMYTPVFWEDKLFCWVLSNCHMGDIGGMSPGSFCAEAPDMFHESTPVPPIKLARRGVIQNDVADMFIRKSRTPDLVALQIRSGMAGLRTTRLRMIELLQEHGPVVVKGAMRRMIRDCSAAVGRRLELIPDGEWEETLYISSAGPNDRDAHRLVTKVRKEGDRLIFSNFGSDAQYYAANAPFSAWRSALVSAGSNMLAYDQLYCPAGVIDHMEFQPTPGTVTVATYPAAVTPLTASIVCVYLASQVVSKMVLAGPDEVRDVANASGGVSLPGWWVASGLDRHGNVVADLTGDSLNGSIGAFPMRDGVDTGGAWWWPNSNAGNLEEWEASLPIMYLYRREQVNSGGAGRWRGGNGLEVALVSHKTDTLNAQIIACDPAVNTSPGLAGGMPGHPGNFMRVEGSPIAQLLSEGKLPEDRIELEAQVGQLRRLSPKASFSFGSGDIFSVEYSGGGGFGDALLRDPAMVEDDVSTHRITIDHAKTMYGVVLSDDGVVEPVATTNLRASIRKERLAAATAPTSTSDLVVDTKEVAKISDVLGVFQTKKGDWWWACSECGQTLTPVTENFKNGASLYERNPYQIDPVVYPNPEDFCDVKIVMRQFLCPACATVLGTECCRADDVFAHDVRLTSTGLQTIANR
jgi:N-methylhydantoinase B